MIKSINGEQTGTKHIFHICLHFWEVIKAFFGDKSRQWKVRM